MGLYTRHYSTAASRCQPVLGVPEPVIDAGETENAIENGFRPSDLGINMATKLYPGVSLNNEIRFRFPQQIIS